MRILKSIIITLLITSSLYTKGQSIKTYKGQFKKGIATYQYFEDTNKMRIFHGNFYYKETYEGWSKIEKIIKGRYRNNLKDGLWVYTRKLNGKTTTENQIKGSYINGKLNGKWLCSNVDYNHVNTSTTANFNNNNFIGKFIFSSKYGNVKGYFNNEGFIDSTWTVTYTDCNEGVIRTTYKFNNGILYYSFSMKENNGEVLENFDRKELVDSINKSTKPFPYIYASASGESLKKEINYYYKDILEDESEFYSRISKVHLNKDDFKYSEPRSIIINAIDFWVEFHKAFIVEPYISMARGSVSLFLDPIVILSEIDTARYFNSNNFLFKQALYATGNKNYSQAISNYTEILNRYYEGVEDSKKERLQNKIDSLEVVFSLIKDSLTIPYLKKADSLFQIKEYKACYEQYQFAGNIKSLPDTTMENYNFVKNHTIRENALIEGDKFFKEEKYHDALKKYLIAKEIKISEELINKIEKTQSIINFRLAINAGYNYLGNQKYKDAFYEYSNAQELFPADSLTARIEDLITTIDRIDSLQTQRYTYYKHITTEMDKTNENSNHLNLLLSDKKDIYGENYRLCTLELVKNFSSYQSSVIELFKENTTDGLTIEETWNTNDQKTLDILIIYYNEFEKYQQFYNNVKQAFETKDNKKLKLLKSSNNANDIISLF